jgi:prepilin-type N-terminal cleavage/methylation domain-containing protein
MIRRVDRRGSGPARGATLLELMVAMAIMGIVSAFAAPSYHRCIEQGRADLAAGQLRALWVAERVWRLDHPAYADPAILAAAGLIESGLASDDGPYRYEVDPSADPEAFWPGPSGSVAARGRARSRSTRRGPSMGRSAGPARRPSAPDTSSRSTSAMRTRPGIATRPAFTYLEVQVALSLFGITLAGLGSMALTQIRLVRSLEHRVACQPMQGAPIALGRSNRSVIASVDADPDAGAVLRSAEAWARRLGAGASLVSISLDPGGSAVVGSPAPLQAPEGPYESRHVVSIVEVSAGGDPSRIRVALAPLGGRP